MIYEPEVISAHLTDLFTDTALVALLPGGVHETDATDTVPTPGSTATRRETPYLVFAFLAPAGVLQGAGGTVLCADVDYRVQVFHRPSEVSEARQALRLVQGLLEGAEASIAVAGSIPAHNLVIRYAGPLPRLPHREMGGKLIYAEGSRWRVRVQRAS